jgi:hypothetical protein
LVIGWNVRIEIEGVEQLVVCRALSPHHLDVPPKIADVLMTAAPERRSVLDLLFQRNRSSPYLQSVSERPLGSVFADVAGEQSRMTVLTEF